MDRSEMVTVMRQGLKSLETLLDPYDWFVEASIDGRRYVVYVSYMTEEQSIVPDIVDGHQVVMAFAISRPINENPDCVECNGVGMYFQHYGPDQYNFDGVYCEKCDGSGKMHP
jgi:hypothetical protein